MTWKLRAGLLSAVLGMLLNANVASAQPIELKLAYFVGDQHAMSQWLIKWAEQPGKGFRRPHRGQALPRLADGAGAAAL